MLRVNVKKYGRRSMRNILRKVKQVIGISLVVIMVMGMIPVEGLQFVMELPGNMSREL